MGGGTGGGADASVVVEVGGVGLVDGRFSTGGNGMSSGVAGNVPGADWSFTGAVGAVGVIISGKSWTFR